MFPASKEALSTAGRLTRADLLLMRRVSMQMVVGGLWQSAYRAADGSCDCFEIERTDERRSALSIGLLPTGRYFYMDHRTGEVRLAGTLSEVLDQVGLYLPADEVR